VMVQHVSRVRPLALPGLRHRTDGVRFTYWGGHVPPFACLEEAELPSASGDRVTFLCWPTACASRTRTA